MGFGNEDRVIGVAFPRQCTNLSELYDIKGVVSTSDNSSNILTVLAQETITTSWKADKPYLIY